MSEVNGQPTIEISGNIDENFDLEMWVPSTKCQEVQFYCQGISRINSTGTKLWIIFFNGLRKSGLRLTFYDVPLPVLEQTHYIEEFLSVGEIRSMCVGFFCETCNLDVYVKRDLPLTRDEFLSIFPNCQKCSEKMVLDGLEEDYTFLISSQ